MRNNYEYKRPFNLFDQGKPPKILIIELQYALIHFQKQVYTTNVRGICKVKLNLAIGPSLWIFDYFEKSPDTLFLVESAHRIVGREQLLYSSKNRKTYKGIISVAA